VKIDDPFLAYCLAPKPDWDLEEGALLLAQTEYPDFNLASYVAILDRYAADLRVRLDSIAPPHRALEVINQYLFDEQGFRGNADDYYDPDNNYLNRVLDRRTGNPISLCIVYLLVGRRLSFPLSGVGMPGHFVCRWRNGDEEIYIDAFNRGAALTRADCLEYLARGNYDPKPEHLEPLPAEKILLRLCTNLHHIYRQRNQPEQVERTGSYLAVLGSLDQSAGAETCAARAGGHHLGLFTADNLESIVPSLTQRAKSALAGAHVEAQRLGQTTADTEHLLLGLLELNQGVAINVLHKFGLNLNQLQGELARQLREHPAAELSAGAYSNRVLKTLRLAAQEARALNHGYVGTEHLLLGLLRECEGRGGQALLTRGLTIEAARQEVVKELNFGK